MNCEEARELLEAFHDNELTLDTRAAVEAHIKTCASCTLTLARLADLSAAIKAVGPFPVPEGLHQKVQHLIASADHGAMDRKRRWVFGALAASHIGVAVLGGALAYGVMNGSFSRELNTEEVLSAHVRSLMDGQLVQVTSSDTHTVRPWFAGKVDFSPDVTDFAREGFPLIGARVDYVGGAKVAALVYRHDKHVINVFVSPTGWFGVGGVQQSHKNGYTVVEWRKDDLRYRAISDLNASELADFVRKLDAERSR